MWTGAVCEQQRLRITTNREVTVIFGEEKIIGARKLALRWACSTSNERKSNAQKNIR